MTEKRLKEQIKEMKKWIRSYKRELKIAQKNEEWAAVEHISDQINMWNSKLAVLEAQYKKFDRMEPIPEYPNEWGVK